MGKLLSGRDGQLRVSSGIGGRIFSPFFIFFIEFFYNDWLGMPKWRVPIFYMNIHKSPNSNPEKKIVLNIFFIRVIDLVLFIKNNSNLIIEEG